jgi:hypothetical protein
MFLSKLILSLSNLSKPFAIATDASKYATGGILLQTNTNGDWKPCSYLSQTFSPAERNYDIYDRKLLAVIRALKSWRQYLHGSPFPIQVFTDHKNLTYFRQPQRLNCRQAHWLLDIADFDLKLIYISGKLLAALDALSRHPDLIPDSDDDNDDVSLLPPSLFVNLIDTALSDKISVSSSSDPLVLDSLRALEGDLPPKFQS